MAAPANAEARRIRFCRITAGIGTTERRERAFEIDNAPGEIKKPEGTVADPMPLEGDVLLIKKEASPTETQREEWCWVPVLAMVAHLHSLLERGEHDLHVRLFANEPNPEDVPSVFYYYKLSPYDPTLPSTIFEMEAGNATPDNPPYRGMQLSFLGLKQEKDRAKIEAIVGEIERWG